ncbi:MAG: glycosyltransferase family 2 protein [Candidatus Omnitrophota bacterium]
MSSQQHSQNRYLVGICSLNEGEKIRRVVEKFNDYELYDVLIIDDGSDDGSIASMALNKNVTVLRNQRTRGAGFGVRQILEFASDGGYEACLFVSGNDKDNPGDIAKVVAAIEQGFDLVQGSRYLKGGGSGNMPVYRQLATRFVHPLLFSMLTARRITDSTNGFRGVRISLYRDLREDLKQSWLDQYELEPYLFYKAIRSGYRVCEVPVRKFYPPKQEGYTKMKPFSGWWSILRPLVLLGLRIKD